MKHSSGPPAGGPLLDEAPGARARKAHALPVVASEILEGLSCSLPPAGAARRAQEVSALFARAGEVLDVADGVELKFSGDEETARRLVDFVLVERGCCSGLTYALEFGPRHPEVRLRLTGPAEMASAARAWVGVGT
jgi:hypothetical protein